MNYDETMNFINSFSKRGGSICDLSRFQRLMQMLGNPQDKLRFIHVAGTNGKGSCVRYLASVLSLSGYKTGEFTSPFIVEYTDRIRINNENIPKDVIGNYALKVKECVGQNKDYSQFEITTAIAFLYFNANNCDVVCLETGIGGLLDCTNIIKNPLVSTIMSISFDHTALLGNTITEISTQKAGIIKPHCPCVLSCDNGKECFDVIEATARKNNSKLIVPDENDIRIIETSVLGNTFEYKGLGFTLSMGGKHQIFNAVTAIETLQLVKQQGFDIPDRCLIDGIKSATVPSRAEVFSVSPLVLVDGAHNPSGMKALSDILKTFDEKPVAVLGMLNTKDITHALGNIAPYISRAICLDSFYPNAVNAIEVKKILDSFGVKSEVGSDINSTVKDVLSLKKDVVFCGSLYLTSKIRNILTTLKQKNYF